MGYKIEEKSQEDVEVREIVVGEYFEFDGDVYQRFSVSANFTVVAKPAAQYPIYAVCLSNNSICYFSTEGKTKVTRLHEQSPVILTRLKS